MRIALLWFICLAAVMYIILQADHSLIGQVRGLFSGRLPSFSACIRLILYIAGTAAYTRMVQKMKVKIPNWVFWSASATSFVLAAFFPVANV
jgi:hypothetical protein